jgi:hypothetical protein
MKVAKACLLVLTVVVVPWCFLGCGDDAVSSGLPEAAQSAQAPGTPEGPSVEEGNQGTTRAVSGGSGTIPKNAPRVAPMGAFVAYLGTSTDFEPVKPRYRRGERMTIRLQVLVHVLTYTPDGWRETSRYPAQNVQVFVSEKSTRGTIRIGTLRTDRNGIARMPYVVPTDPNKDNVRICGWTWHEEPFEGQEKRIPIG